MEGNVFFVSGIDTNIGKTWATGLLAKALAEAGRRVITQKMVQTGCTAESEDIVLHRQIQGVPLNDDDRSGLTCPYIFTYPCSPHMAAARDGAEIDPARITEATCRLCEKYEVVLLEGAGGLMVPVTETLTTLEYVRDCGYPLVLVTSGRLGSINHTLLSLFACRQYGVEVKAVLYNLYPAADEAITRNTLGYLRGYLETHHPGAVWLTLPDASEGGAIEGDLEQVFE